MIKLFFTLSLMAILSISGLSQTYFPILKEKPNSESSQTSSESIQLFSLKDEIELFNKEKPKQIFFYLPGRDNEKRQVNLTIKQLVPEEGLIIDGPNTSRYTEKIQVYIILVPLKKN